MFELAWLKHHPTNSQRWARWLCCETRWTFTRSRLDFKTAWKLNVNPEKIWLQKMGQKVTFFLGCFLCCILYIEKNPLFWGDVVLRRTHFAKLWKIFIKLQLLWGLIKSRRIKIWADVMFFFVVLLRWFLIWCCDDFHDDLFVVLLDDFDCNLMCQKKESQGRISGSGIVTCYMVEL